jgi:hypothetical protein
MIKVLSAVVASAAIAGLLIFVPGSIEVAAGTPAPGAKGDRLPFRTAITFPNEVGPTRCFERAWPYFDRVCGSEPHPRGIRIVAIDRVAN